MNDHCPGTVEEPLAPDIPKGPRDQVFADAVTRADLERGAPPELAYGARRPARRVIGASSRVRVSSELTPRRWLRGQPLSGVLGTALLPALGLIAPRAPQLVQAEDTRILELAGGRFRYQSTGTGDEALLFLHGFNSQLSIWDDVWPVLDERGRSVRLDIPGYGGSDWPAASYALPKQAERVIMFMNALGLTRVTLVGVSMGASLSAWIAAHHPDRVKGLLLLAPSGYPGALHYRGPFGRLLDPGRPRRWATRIANSGLYRRRYPNSRALQALTVTASYGEPWARALEDIRVHAWLLWSRGDACVPFAYAGAVARSIPESTLVPLSELVGHDVPRHRPELIGRLAGWIHRGSKPEPILRALDDLLGRSGDL